MRFALITGTSVGSKVTEVAEKVAMDTAEDLKQAAGSFEGDIPGTVKPLQNGQLVICCCVVSLQK